MLTGTILYLAMCIASTYAAWKMRNKRGIHDSPVKYFLLWGALSPFNLLWEVVVGREPDPRAAERANAQTHKDARARLRAFRANAETGTGTGVGLCAQCANYESRYGTCREFKIGVTAHVVKCKRFAGTART